MVYQPANLASSRQPSQPMGVCFGTNCEVRMQTLTKKKRCKLTVVCRVICSVDLGGVRCIVKWRWMIGMLWSWISILLYYYPFPQRVTTYNNDKHWLLCRLGEEHWEFCVQRHGNGYAVLERDGSDKFRRCIGELLRFSSLPDYRVVKKQ